MTTAGTQSPNRTLRPEDGGSAAQGAEDRYSVRPPSSRPSPSSGARRDRFDAPTAGIATPTRLMVELHDAGIQVFVQGERLRLEPMRGPIPSRLRQRVADGKPGLLALLASAEGDTLRTLLDLAIDEDLPGATVGMLTARDLYACGDLPRKVLSAFLRALARSQGMAAGRVPASWTRVADCMGCGQVLLWPGAPAAVIACPWCRHRRAGRALPRPREWRPPKSRAHPRLAAT